MAKIIGNTTATPNPNPDWNQTDPTKADYIKNKPDLSNIGNGGITKNYIARIQVNESLRIDPDLTSGIYLLCKGASVEFLALKSNMYGYEMIITDAAVDTEIIILDSYIEDGINKRKVYIGEGVDVQSLSSMDFSYNDYGSVWIYSWETNGSKISGEFNKCSNSGNSGVYVGSGDMPEDCNVQIDPDGEVLSIDQTYNPNSINPQSGKAVAEALQPIETDVSTIKNNISGLNTELQSKQDILINGETIRTVNGESILGDGNIILSAETMVVDGVYNPNSINAQSGKAVAEAVANLADSAELKHLRDTYCKQLCTKKRVISYNGKQDVLDEAEYATVVSIGGKTIDFQQMINPANFYSGSKTENGVVFTNNGNGSITANGTSTGLSRVMLYSYSDNVNTVYPVIQGHKYLLCGCPSISGCSMSWSLRFTDKGEGIIDTATSTTNIYVYCKVDNGATVENAVFKPQLYDLTAIFGSGNEPTSLAEFRKVFPKEFYTYSQDTEINADIVSVDYYDKNNVLNKSITIPQELKNIYPLRSNESVYDEYDFSTMQYVKRVDVEQVTSFDISEYFADVDFTTDLKDKGYFVCQQSDVYNLMAPLNVDYYLPKLTNQTKNVTVGTMNVADFGITGEGYTEEELAVYIPKWKELITKWFKTADFLVFIEWYPYLDKNQSVSAYETLFKQFYPYYYLEPVKQNKAIISKYPCDVEQFIGEDGNTATGFDCIKAVTNIGGKSVAIISWLTGYASAYPDTMTPVEWRQSRYNVAVRVLADYDAVILAGDFNNSDKDVGTSEWSIFTDAGYTLGNGGYWGDIVTCPSNVNHNENGAIDNIITRGFVYNDFSVGDYVTTKVSDHEPIKADLTLLL